MDDDFLADEEALSAFLARFEDGTWPGAQFRHIHHLAVAVCYAVECDEPMEKLRTRIRSYNLSQGGENTEDRGYHETITRFWLEIVSGYLDTLPEGLARVDKARLVVAEFASKRDLFHEYYDFDILKSREARAVWIAPSRSSRPGPITGSEPQSSSPLRPNS